MAVYNFSPVPSDAATYLKVVAPHAALANATWSLWIIVDLLLVVIVPALFVLLRRSILPAAVLGAGLLAFYVVFDIAVTESTSLRLVSLAQSYASSTGSTHTGYLSTASSILASFPTMTLISFVTGSVGLVILSALMLNGPVRRRTAVFGIAANGLGVIGGLGAMVPALAVATTPSLWVIGLWYIVLGLQLYRLSSAGLLGRSLPAPSGPTAS
jgi:hypothetical protein